MIFYYKQKKVINFLKIKFKDCFYNYQQLLIFAQDQNKNDDYSMVNKKQ